jgi:hypothetical protein
MTRLELARLRAARAKRGAALASVVAFLVTMGLVRASHPGHSTHAASTSTAVATSSSSASTSDDSESEAPQVVQVPQVQTHVS